MSSDPVGAHRAARSTGPGQASGTPIDPNQLLSLCHAIRENLDTLDGAIRLVRLRLASLSYARTTTTTNAADRAAATSSSSSSLSPGTKCLSDLADLGQLNQTLVRQLDELQAKLMGESSQNTLGFHIASQQLAYFTSEWYDNLTPKLRVTLEMAEKFQLIGGVQGQGQGKGQRQMAWRTKAIWFSSPGATSGVENGATQKNLSSPEHDEANRAKLQQPIPPPPPPPIGSIPIGATETRVREALVRLKQSVSENERLIASIASNLEYTKATIEAIYQSLRTTKVNLELGEQNALESIQVVRASEQSKLWATLICAGILTIAMLIVLRLVGII